MNELPLIFSLTFVATVGITLLFFLKASNYSKVVLIILLVWIAVQSILGISGFYFDSYIVPPRFPLLIVPPIFLMLFLFLNQRGRAFIDSLNIKTLHLLHLVRIPVELVLFYLFSYKLVPELMTFEGRNFDIISGLSAPFIYYFGLVKNKVSIQGILFWNFFCLGLLFNIVINAVLSAPFPFQQFAFDQPNIAVLYFPFVLLPSFIVPLVLFSHLVSIRRFLKEMKVT